MSDPNEVDATASEELPSEATAHHGGPPPDAGPLDGADPAEGGPAPDGDEPVMTVESLVSTLEGVTAERDSYLDTLRRLQAEFENYRKAVAKRESDARERANEGLVAELLPVLDACDGAVANGAEDVALIRSTLLDALSKQGLGRLAEAGELFDPELHEAVMHEEGDGSGPVVAEVLRVGYQWRGRTLRAAMVKVRG